MDKKTPDKQLEKTEEKLDPRWFSFQSFYLESGNAYKSAIEAGFSEEYAKVITSRIPNKVIKSLNDALQEKGVTPEKIADRINDLLDAKRSTLMGEVPDYQAIDKGITHAIKIRGDYAPDKSISIVANVKGKEMVRELASKLKGEIIDEYQS